MRQSFTSPVFNLTPGSYSVHKTVFFLQLLAYSVLILLFLAIPSSSIAQNTSNADIRGSVVEKSTGQALSGANIALTSSEGVLISGTISGNNGFYQLNNISPGMYLLNVSYVGYQTYRVSLTITSDENHIRKNIVLVSSEATLDELVVYGSQARDQSAGQILISSDVIARAPTPSGSADLVNYIQTQPGVVATGDRGGQLFVRGGTPSENLVLMDGTLIYQPFHIIGFFSVFPEQLMDRTNFYAGGFGAKYSGRASSVLDVKLKNGNLYKPGWSASASPFVLNLFAETPLTEGESSLVFSTRKSLIENYSAQFLSERQPLDFNSQFIKYSNIDNGGLRFSTFFLRTKDHGQLDFLTNEYFEWGNLITGFQLLGASESSTISQVEFNFGITSFYNETGYSNHRERYSDVFKINMDLNFARYLGNWRLDFGTTINYNETYFDVGDHISELNEQGVTYISTRAFFSLEMPFNDYLSATTGISATSFLGKVNGSLEPRAEISWKPRGKIDEELHIAAGIYDQSLVGITDFRDAGTAFTAWVLPSDKNRKLQAKHLLAGWRQPVTDWLSFSVEGYLKELSDVPVSTWSPAATSSTKIAYASGEVKGVDVRVDLNWHSYYLSAGYGYSNTLYKTAQDDFGKWFGEPVQTFHPSHDRRHQITLQTGFEKNNFQANLSWTLGTGFPYTRPIGFDNYFLYTNNLPEVENQYGEPRILLDKPFNGRLPDYHRLDVSVAYTFSQDIVQTRVQLGAINTYDQNNFFYYDVFTQKGIKQLPLIPYLSVKVSS